MNLEELVPDKRRIIIPRFYKWLIANPDVPLTEDRAEMVRKMLVAKGRERRGTFSASSAGQCWRRQSLDFYGAPSAETFSAKQLLIFKNGTWIHMMLQTALLDAGIISSIEGSLWSKPLRIRGSIDGQGVVPDNHPNKEWRGKEFGLEIKTINTYGYKAAIEKGPQEGHLDQIHRYMYMSGYELFVVLYWDKNTQDMHEWVVTQNPELLERQRQEVKTLNLHLDQGRLPERIASCQAQMGPVFKNCPYGRKEGTCFAVGEYAAELKELGVDVDYWRTYWTSQK